MVCSSGRWLAPSAQGGTGSTAAGNPRASLSASPCPPGLPEEVLLQPESPKPRSARGDPSSTHRFLISGGDNWDTDPGTHGPVGDTVAPGALSLGGKSHPSGKVRVLHIPVVGGGR